jgi:opacity protein-like surface antigen
MKLLKLTAILIPLLCAATFIFAGDFRSDEDAYAYGFRAGYNHGVADNTARLQFNFRSVSVGISFNSYDDDHFRKGFEDGYTDGYYREARSSEVVVNNSYDPQGFQIGYREGYGHGLTDRQSGLDFNYRHDHRSESGIGYDSYSSATFQSGYLQGYKQGYYGASVDVGYRPASTIISAPPRSGFVVAFKDDDFQGKIQEFPVGRYPKLHDGWNDSIGSIQVSGNVRVILFEDDDFKGKQLVIERSMPDLGDFNFDDKTGSMIVEPMY